MTTADGFLLSCAYASEGTGFDPSPDDVIWAAKKHDDGAQTNFNDGTGVLVIKFSDGSDVELQATRVH